ncbi:MAG: putative lipid II flippase FtsW [Rickettsiales bacterium]|nr:putative lipid II flippase FtsW [Rickettsiales bacterium]
MESWEIKANSVFDRRHLNIFKKWWIDIDKINFLIVLGIIIFGLMMTASSSPAIAKRIDVEKFFFLKKQLIFAAIALFLLIAISFLDQEKIKIFSIAGLIITIILLIAVLLFGAEAKGAKRWISFSGFTLQPSEFAKAFFVIANAYIFQKFDDEEWWIKYGCSFALFFIIICLLILQPDFGMTIAFTILWLAQIFAYGLPIFLIATIAVLALVGSVGAYIAFPHVENRINRFLDADGKNYQAERSIDAFINGSFFGVGPGNGVVKKFIPDAHTDFIFAVVGEEYGILSCAIIILIFAYLTMRIVKRALEEEDSFVYLALCGLMMQFSMQVIINIGVSLRLLPTKGMTLPFISYGGSSMIATAICFGLILAFTKRKYHRHVDYGNLKLI